MTRVASSRELLHQSSTLIEVDDAGAIGSAARCLMCSLTCAPRTCKTSSAAACSLQEDDDAISQRSSVMCGWSAVTAGSDMDASERTRSARWARVFSAKRSFLRS